MKAKNYRESKKGRFVSKEFANENPDETVGEKKMPLYTQIFDDFRSGESDKANRKIARLSKKQAKEFEDCLKDCLTGLVLKGVKNYD